MRRIIISAVLGAGLPLAAGSAWAQVGYDQPGQRPLGGGLIEYLMSGRERGGRPGYDPFADPGRRQVASLPAASEGTRIARGIDPIYRRQTVAYDGGEVPGTIVVDTGSRFLYHVRGQGLAVRYGIGVGRPGFEWAGMKTVTMKREWPDWTPPPEMLRRRPDLPRHMAGGPGNPLGARALYLGSSLYRIHGTNEPHTIGQDVSSGCIRMMNEDVIDLYGNVAVGTTVKVI